MDNAMIEEIVKEVLKSLEMPEQSYKPTGNKCESKQFEGTVSKADYPLAEKRKDLIKTASGRGFDDINLENVLNGNIKPEDIKITSDVLLYQSQIAESVGRYQFAQNLKRAAELTKVPDDRILEIYNSLRPYRSTKDELLNIADELEKKYNAILNAALIREAADVYEKRGRLKK